MPPTFAARWITTSAPATASRQASRSRRSWSLDRTAVTSAPSSARSRTVGLPRNPPPPVTAVRLPSQKPGSCPAVKASGFSDTWAVSQSPVSESARGGAQCNHVEVSASNAAPWAGGRETARRLSNWLGGVGAELAALAALLLATAAFGRTFSHIELGFSWLHPTEAVLGLVTVVVLVQIGPREAWRRVAATGVLIPLAIFWLFGAIAAVRGLVEWGFSLTLEDIGLVEYSLLIPIVALTVTSREQLLWLTTLIGLSGILAIAVQSVELWTPSAWDLETQLNLIEVATGMYIGVYVVWVLARLASDVPVPRWHQVLMVLGVGLIVVGLSRAAWLAVLAAMALTILLAVRRRRWVAASAAAAAVVLGVAFSIPVENVGERSRGSDGPNVANEIGASFEPDGEGGQNVNARWRLAYWRFTLEESAERPLNGVGFGRPANFIWNGVPYDRRTGDPSDSHDVTPPHNSFMNVLYRMGVL